MQSVLETNDLNELMNMVSHCSRQLLSRHGRSWQSHRLASQCLARGYTLLQDTLRIQAYQKRLFV